MSDIFSIIRHNSPKIKNSNLILSRFKNDLIKGEEDVLEKSIVDSLSYNQDIKIEKTGKEIKESLINVRSKIEMQKNEHYQNMIAYKKEAGIEPEGKDGYYYGNSDLSDRIEAPKIYSYEQRWGKNGEVKSDNSITYPKSEASVNSNQKEAMDKYNDCASKYTKCLADLVTIDTLTKNLSDNKKITLSVMQASALGF